jgi:hypothetical protein
MSKPLPPNIVNIVRAEIFRIADEERYLFKSRRENGLFMDFLVQHPNVGGILSDYLPKERIRTYVKDGVLRVYTKLKRDIALPVGSDRIKIIISDVFGTECDIVERKLDIVLVRFVNGDFCIIALGTILKWETALRKALEVNCQIKKSNQSKSKNHLLLLLAKLNLPLTDSDLKHLVVTLGNIDVRVFISDNDF